MLNDGAFQGERSTERFGVEERLKITKSKPDSLGDGLSSISRIENSICGCFWQQIDNSMRKILNLIYHNVVNLRSIIASETDVVQDVIDSIHKVVASTSNFPPLVLAEYFVNIKFLLASEEWVWCQVYIGILSEVLFWILMCLCWSLNNRVYFRPNEVRSDGLWVIISFYHPWPEMHNEILVVNFKG